MRTEARHRGGVFAFVVLGLVVICLALCIWEAARARAAAVDLAARVSRLESLVGDGPAPLPDGAAIGEPGERPALVAAAPPPGGTLVPGAPDEGQLRQMVLRVIEEREAAARAEGEMRLMDYRSSAACDYIKVAEPYRAAAKQQLSRALAEYDRLRTEIPEDSRASDPYYARQLEKIAEDLRRDLATLISAEQREALEAYLARYFR